VFLERVISLIFQLAMVDYLIIAIYFFFVIFIGLLLRRRVRTSKDFFLAGRSNPSWIAGLAFISANMGALELLGMCAGAYEYGFMQVQFYWLGAVPAILFLALFMMPLYYGTKVHSVPAYLKLRYNEATRGLNAGIFAIMTLLLSGISMYALALIFNILIGWSINQSIILSAVIIGLYVSLGGLTSSIYNEIIQFFLIWFGLLLLPILGLSEVGGWTGLAASIPESFSHVWAYTANSSQNAMGIDWIGLVMGLGFVLSFGYWCTDFLVIQRTLSAKDMEAAQKAPLIGAAVKLVLPFIAILPGLLALSLIPGLGQGGQSYNLALPLLIKRYFPPGLIGLGLTALMAGFMSGMSGNITAFSTVWTDDLYKTYINPKASDKHLVWIGRLSVIVGVVISIGTAYIAMSFPSIMDYMQALFSLINAPLFATILLGMFWKRTTQWGGFFGLLSGIVIGIAMFALIPASYFGSVMAANIWRAWWTWSTCFTVTLFVSLLTKPKSTEELEGVVYGMIKKGEIQKQLPWYARPVTWAAVIIICLIIVNVIFF
jgi:SSS family solute:Na+ symporter